MPKSITKLESKLTLEQQKEIKKHLAYRNFSASIKSSETKRLYTHHLFQFLSYKSHISIDELLHQDHKTTEMDIIDLIIDLKENKCLSSSSLNNFIAALVHFFSINDVVLNRKKISKFMGEHEHKFEYRSYTHDEIGQLLSVMDERGKAVVLLMASTGMRVGAIPTLKLKHLKRWEIDDQGTHVYQIEVYANSQKYKYKTFCTPECAKSIDQYLELRRRHGENIKQDSNTGNWLPIDIPLIIKQFNKNSNVHVVEPIVAHSISLKIIVTKLQQLGIRKKIMITEDSQEYRSKFRHDLHPCHSLRIFAVTNMQRSKLDKTIREMLVGHSTGLDAVYYKPQEEEILTEYLKAVDNLTINNEFRLKKQVEYYKKKADTVDMLKEQFEKMQEQFRLINQGKELQ